MGGEGSGALTGMSRQLRGALVSPVLRQRLVLLMARERGADYELLTGLIEAGELRSALDSCYPLEHAADAVRQLEDGTIRGKVAITVGPSD